MARVLVLCALMVAAADATCYCSNSWTLDNSWYWRITGCNDNELKAECERAEWELVDWVNAVMAFARTVAVHPRGMSQEDAINHAALSHAIEKRRPVADCATGVFTTEQLNGNTHSMLCYSKNLLAQCQMVADGIAEYQASVITELVLSDATEEFVNMIKLRVLGSIPPVVKCMTTDAVINGAGRAVPLLGPMLATVLGALVWH